MTHKTNKVIISLALMVAAFVFAASGLAQACCIYNNSRYPFKVEWNVFSGWTISPSNHQCTNGTGGKVKIHMLDGLRNTYISHPAFLEIDDHGWLSVYK